MEIDTLALQYARSQSGIDQLQRAYAELTHAQQVMDSLGLDTEESSEAGQIIMRMMKSLGDKNRVIWRELKEKSE